MESWGGGIGQGSVVNALPWGPKPWAPTLLKGRRVGEMGLSCLQPLHSPGQHRETQISTSCCFMEPQIPTLCWEKALGPPQHCARPPHTPFWGTPRDQSGQCSLHRGFIPNLAVPIPSSPPRTLIPVLPALCALTAAPRSLRGDKATISRPPTTTAHTRVQGLEGPQGATAMGVQGLGHGEPTQQPPLLWAHPIPPRAPMGAGPGRQHPALVPPALPCCSVRCRPAVTGDIPVCTTGFIEHGEAGGRGRVRTESCGQSTAPLGVRGGIFIPGHGVEA